ncbi:MAG: S41 family peptidase [Terriglobales bacterium]
MSEKIYSWLLRFFPSHFRQTYGDDALRLFRDRARDERGFLPSLRLWFDMLSDFAISVPREYFYAQPELLCAPAHHRAHGTPLFYVLGNESPRAGALVFGAMLSFCALATFSTLLDDGGNPRRFRSSHPPSYAGPQSAVVPPSSASARPAPQSANSSTSSAASHDQSDAATSAATSISPNAATPAARTTQSDSSPMTTSNVQPAQFTASERHRIVTAAVENLKQHYIRPEVARQMSDALLAHENRGDDNATTTDSAFSALLTKQIRNVSHDMHLELVYSESPLPDRPGEPSPEVLASYRNFLQENNCTFEKVEILPHNLGYLKLNSFPDVSICQSTATAAMHHLNNADALIFDLRDNRGGQPDMVVLMLAYLFDHPTYIYNPRENTTRQSWTASPIPGNNLADKPVYVLTSPSTFSGAEQFCYNLKMLKRVTLIGETTGGAAHAGVFHRLDDHFGMGIPEVQPINPYSTADWAGIGVNPDVKVKAADALQTAESLAVSKLSRQ